MSTILNVYGKSMTVDVPDDTRLPWTLREVLGTTGNAIFAATSKRDPHAADRRPTQELTLP